MDVTPAHPTNERSDLARHDAKPKRPLSAFNLFYRFKRRKVLEAMAAGAAADKDSIRALIAAAPGSEDLPAIAANGAAPDLWNPLRRQTIRSELKENMEARDTRDRLHRKDQGAMNGAMTFVEMGKLMNASWKSCDAFAKSVFSELAEEGRKRYRQRIEEYNARCRRPANVAESVACGKKSDEKKSPAKKNRSPSLPARFSSLKAKNDITASTVALPLPRWKDHESDGGIAINGTADITTSAKCTPSKGNNMGSPFGRKDDCVVSLSLLDLLVKNDVPHETKPASMDTGRPERNGFPVSAYSSSQDMLLAIFPHALSDIDARLMWRVRELEHQLAAERLHARIRALQDEISCWNVGGTLPRSALDNVVPQDGAAVPAPSVPDGLWSLVSASMIHPSVPTSERATMLSRIVEPKRPRVAMFQTSSLGSLGEHPNKKQRVG